MKIKRVIENLKIIFFNLRNDNIKNISRNFSGAVEELRTVWGSVLFQIVP